MTKRRPTRKLGRGTGLNEKSGNRQWKRSAAVTAPARRTRRHGRSGPKKRRKKERKREEERKRQSLNLLASEDAKPIGWKRRRSNSGRKQTKKPIHGWEPKPARVCPSGHVKENFLESNVAGESTAEGIHLHASSSISLLTAASVVSNVWILLWFV